MRRFLPLTRVRGSVRRLRGIEAGVFADIRKDSAPSQSRLGKWLWTVGGLMAEGEQRWGRDAQIEAVLAQQRLAGKQLGDAFGSEKADGQIFQLRKR